MSAVPRFAQPCHASWSAVIGVIAVSCATSYPTVQFGPEEVDASAAPREETELSEPHGESKTLSMRSLVLNLADPLMGYEANSNLWYSMGQALGRLSDHLEIVDGLGQNAGGRVLLTVLAFYVGRGTQYYSHEVAHEFEVREHGLSSGLSVDWGDWGPGWPRYVQPVFYDNDVYYDALADDEVLRVPLDGLNQDEFNGAQSWRRAVLQNRTDMHNAAAFLLLKLNDFRYVLSVGLDDNRPAWTGGSVREVNQYAWYAGCWNDPDLYTLHLYNRGIDLTKTDYLVQVAIADFLSWHTWENLAMVCRYVGSGRRVAEPKTWQLSDKVALTPPLVSVYLTPRGTFYDIGTFVNPTSPHPLFLSFGTDVDSIGDGEVDRLRLGAQYYDLGRGRWRWAPFAYVDMSEAQGYEGVSLGTEGNIRLSSAVELSFKLEYNENDVIENTVKGKDDGLSLALGVDVRF